MRDHAADGAVFEEVGIISHRPYNTVPRLIEIDVEIQLRSACWNIRLCSAPSHIRNRNWRLQRNRDLEEWVAAGIEPGRKFFD